MISNTAFKPIAEMDLDPIKVKLMHKESGEGWTLEYATKVEAEYRRFLYLMKMFPHEQTAPLFDVDIFWHYHILDTLKYAADCDTVFGYFLHHFPYIGLRGELDEAAHQRVGARMQELYEQTFGEPYIAPAGTAVTAALAAPTGNDPHMSLARSPVAMQIADKNAWSAAVAAAPMVVGKTAWCAVAAEQTWSAAGSKMTTQVVSAKTAGCAVPDKAAWCAVPDQDPGAHRITKSGQISLAPALDRFYAERPSIVGA